MYKNYRQKHCDPLRPYLPAFHGVFEIPISVGNQKRRMLAYVPYDVRESTSGVLVLGENGKTADDLLHNSGWCMLADQEECKEKFIVFFLEPYDGVWNVNESYGIPDGDVAYVTAAAMRAAERWFFCIHESKIYLTGCREGGIIANMAAMWNPAYYGGVVSIGGSAISPSYMNAAQNDFCLNLDGFEDPVHRKGIRKGEVPMPAWIIDDPEAPDGTDNGILDYWRKTCGTQPTPNQLAPDQLEYYRTSQTPWYPNQEKEAYRVCHSVISHSSENSASRMLRRIWKDFLCRQRRWMSSPGGDLRVTRDPVRDLNMEYHYEKYDGWMREWYVYVPKAVNKHPRQTVPLVLAMHGYTCTGEIYIGNSGWCDVADQYGFIVVFPSALHGHVCMPEQGQDPNWAPLPAWNIFHESDRPNELRFFHYLLDRMEKDYPVDSTRIYATGHSWGSLMVQLLGLNIADRLAAIAPCSGVFFGDSLDKITMQPDTQQKILGLPIWMFWGTEENWLIPTNPAHNNQTGRTLNFWLRRNGMANQIPENWESIPCITNGRFFDHRIEQKNCPPVWYTPVDYMPHATMPEMSFRIWEEFFRKFSRVDGHIIQDNR